MSQKMTTLSELAPGTQFRLAGNMKRARLGGTENLNGVLTVIDQQLGYTVISSPQNNRAYLWSGLRIRL